MDEYEVSFGHRYYLHNTLSLMAYAWLANMRRLEQEKSARTDELVELTMSEVHR